MNMRLVWKSLLAVGMSSVLLGAGAAWTAPTQAAAAAHHKPKKKHDHHKHKHGGSGTATHLAKLGSEVAKEKGATFQVVYKTTYGGHSETITFAQQPPKLLVKTTAGSLIDTGTQSLYCSPGSCISVGSTNPFAPLLNLFDATTAEGFFHRAASEAAAKLAGYSVKFSSATFGGLASQCAEVSASGVTGKYCVSNNGLLTYAGSTGGTVELTSYSASVPSGAFTPPSGATIITAPTG